MLGYIHKCGDEVCHLYLTTHINARAFFDLHFDQDRYDYFCEPLQIQLTIFFKSLFLEYMKLALQLLTEQVSKDTHQLRELNSLLSGLVMRR